MANIDVRQAIEEYFERIRRAALVLTGSPWDADDLAQETFLVLARDVDRFEGRSSLYTWLYGILLNLERRSRRQYGARRSKLRVLWDDEARTQAAAPAAETAVEVKEWKRSLWAYVARLPDGQRHALVLRFSQHMSYQEIADTLECPLGTVKSRIFNALASLREMISTAGDEVRSCPTHPQEDLHHAI